MKSFPHEEWRATQIIGLTEKAKLAEPEWQLILQQPGLDFECPCGLPVHSYQGADRWWNVRARKNEQGVHHEKCPVVSGEFALAAIRTENVVYRDSLFLGSVLGSSVGRVRRAAEQGCEAWQGDFCHLVNRALATASLVTLGHLNRSSAGDTGPIRNPSFKQIFAGIADFLDEPRMVDGSSPVEAARRVGMKIYWGLSSELIVHRIHGMRYNPSDETVVLRDMWSPSGPVHPWPRLKIPFATACQLRGKVWAHNRVITPPYLVMTSVDAADVILQMVIIPVAGLHAGHLLTKESDPEGIFVNRIEDSGFSVGLVKLAVQVDMCALGPLWRLSGLPSGCLAVRPDLVCIGRRGSAIFQLAGSRDRYYVDGVNRSLGELRKTMRNSQILIRSVSLDELKKSEPQFLDDIAALV